MEFSELLEMLELDSPSQMVYFENLADLIECDERISFEALYCLIKDADYKTLSELIEEYFNELLNGIPDSATDFYTQMQTIGMSLSGMAKGMCEEDDITLFCEEFERFRLWYVFSDCVNIRPVGGDISSFKGVSPLEAITLSRMERVTSEDKYEYDFESALDYEIKDYVMSFSDVISAGDENLDKGETVDGLIDGFVYDDEFKDEY